LELKLELQQVELLVEQLAEQLAEQLVQMLQLVEQQEQLLRQGQELRHLILQR
jgi:hypothetical protein